MKKPAFLPAEIDNLLKAAAVAFWIVVIVGALGLAWRGLMWVFDHPGLSLSVCAGLLIAAFVALECRRPFRGTKHV